MEKHFLALLLVATGVALSVDAQSDTAQAADFFHLSEQQQILNLAQYLAANDNFTLKLVEIAKSLSWLIEEPTVGGLLPYLLDSLPGVFSSAMFRTAVSITADEIYRAQGQVPQDATAEDKLKNTNWGRAVNRFLASYSARDLFYEETSKQTVDPQCYRETMDFLDALVGSVIDEADITVQHFRWALKMLDTMWKQPGGLTNYSPDYVGRDNLCRQVHAYLPNDETMLLGNRPHNYSTSYGTHFCLVILDLSDGLAKTYGSEILGNPLKLHFGMCYPESCQENDVASMLRIGVLRSLNFKVAAVECTANQQPGAQSVG